MLKNEFINLWFVEYPMSEITGLHFSYILFNLNNGLKIFWCETKGLITSYGPGVFNSEW